MLLLNLQVEEVYSEKLSMKEASKGTMVHQILPLNKKQM